MQISPLSAADTPLPNIIRAASSDSDTGSSGSDGVSGASGSSDDSDSSSNNAGQISSSEFMDLLVAQLQNQDPTNPVDPTTFVTQLVQFNTLEQVIDINQDLTPATTSGTTSGTTASGQV